jgi:glycerol-3-phosphate acyltransferase PlsY
LPKGRLALAAESEQITSSFKDMSTSLIIAAASYLLGSIPFGYLLVRIFRGEDVRQSGSGNIGATNVSRKSPVLGVITLLLDAGKGAAAVLLSYLVARRMGHEAPTYEQLALAALFAVVGHMFPVWLKFRGGKGVATGLGSFILIAPKAVLVAAGIFFAVVLLFRYISLGSVLAVGVFPLLVWFTHQFGVSPGALATIAMASLLIIARHHQNIRRLLAGTESRIRSRRAQQ